MKRKVTRCQAIILSEATRKKRPCQNTGTFDGFCHLHAAGRKSTEVGSQPIKAATKPVTSPWPTPESAKAELRLAREVMAALKTYLHDPSTKGRLVNIFGDYEEQFDVATQRPAP